MWVVRDQDLSWEMASVRKPLDVLPSRLGHPALQGGKRHRVQMRRVRRIGPRELGPKRETVPYRVLRDPMRLQSESEKFYC